MPYKLKRHPQVKKQLRLVPARIAKELAQTIVDLATDPYPSIAEELRDYYAGTWKIKLDGWRIFYRVNEQHKIVTVISGKQRNPDTYRRLS
jgi:addiction module RelE/StbE family toxin